MGEVGNRPGPLDRIGRPICGEKGVFDTSDGTSEGTPLNSNAARFLTPSSIRVDRTNGEVFVSDGEQPNSNHRIAVMDSNGAFLRQWHEPPCEDRSPRRLLPIFAA